MSMLSIYQYFGTNDTKHNWTWYSQYVPCLLQMLISIFLVMCGLIHKIKLYSRTPTKRERGHPLSNNTFMKLKRKTDVDYTLLQMIRIHNTWNALIYTEGHYFVHCIINICNEIEPMVPQSFRQTCLITFCFLTEDKTLRRFLFNIESITES